MNTVLIELRDLREEHRARIVRTEVKIGDRVLVSTGNGLEAAVVIETSETGDEKKTDMEIIRHLNDDDKRVLEENSEYTKKMLPDVVKAVKEEKLAMNLTKIAYTYDRQKLYIYYTADSRVDFRKFIRILGAKLKVRIQMVQIGVRDKASIVGGIGICGREICCSRFLRNIESVNIDMARNQRISLNPENISGCCGRLLCCLRYEDDLYREAKKELPKVGYKVNTPSGKGEVTEVNYVTRIVKVKLETGVINDYKSSEITSAKINVKERLKKLIK
ncbi:MAG: regulatory iron-sulfur-containing complex subunit RicT [Elusimicrobiota bacterium]